MNEESLLRKFGMTSEQIDKDVEVLEDENQDDGVIGPVYYGLHAASAKDEPLVSMTIKLPKAQLESITRASKSYHISRSEYVRRKLAGAVS
ncbi:hypothetical protein HMPREF1583_00700 [Gardnerella vaginalis JCP8151B]|nr:hypothetical protein HMPREF1582_00870 [Gardnerella vaginalis JCP8151A]EPI47042.1 hypothetical protein HMPREF1583_00700 [Gardnerella vaginalis JCP8151B]